MVAAGLAAILLGACASAPRVGEVRHPDGSLAQKGPLVDGLQHGEWTFWYPGGALMARGSYERDERVGSWTHWYENGNLRMRGAYRGERQEGLWEFFYPDGALQCRGEYREGREHGEWVFWHGSGGVQQQGLFVNGKRQLQWRESGSDGRLHARGSYYDDQPVGRWQRAADGGEMTATVFPLPAGVEHLLETWDDGSVRREGFVREGRPEGVWVSRHRGGALRALVTMVEGAPHGEFVARCSDGGLLAIGPLDGGRPAGRWTLRNAAGPSQLQREPATPWDRQWSDATVVDQEPPLRVVDRWLAELCAVPEVAPTAEPPTAAVAEAESPRLEAPTDPGEWTVREREEFELFRRFYRDGWWPRRQQAGSRYGAGPGSTRPGHGDPQLAATIVGRPLPVTSFPTAAGSRLDLATLRGKRVLLVVLRGFTSKVCVYCFQQTAELAPIAPRLAELDCEVVVLYPGSRSRLEAFAAACRSEFGDGGPPYRMVYDPDLDLANALGLQGNLARPAAFVLDRDGIVRHAYIAESIENIADRPPASELLRWVAATQ